MTTELALDELRNDVLRKIGRNVVNFQKMEGMLRFLNAQQDVSGPLVEIEKIAEKASKSVAKRSMGLLAAAFARSAYSGNPPNAEVEREPHGSSASFSVKIESNPEFAKQRKKALASVVAERNKLIHRWLAVFNPNSIESCVELAAALDEQHARVWPEFEILKALMLALRDSHEELRRYVDSDEFLIEPRRSQSDI